MRSWTIAGYIFAINASFAILSAIQPFGTVELMVFGVDTIPIDPTTTTQIGGLDLVDMVAAINLFLTLLVGPLTVLPMMLSALGITGVMATVVVLIGWITYGLAIVQLVTGRMLGMAR